MQTPAGSYALSRPVFVPANSRVQVDMLATFVASEAPKGKNEKAKPVATFFWKGPDGADLAREPIFAIADSGAAAAGRVDGGVSGVIVMQISGAPAGDDELNDATDIPAILQNNTTYPLTGTSIGPDAAMRRDIAFDPCRLVIVDQSALLQLDAAQQESLLTHVRGGATLLVSAANADVAGTWIGSMLPLDIVGRREVAKIESSQFGSIPTRKVVSQLLTVARPNAQVVASNGESVLAAFTELGFGRIAMTAFPLNALDAENTSTASLWGALVGTQRAAFHDPQAIGDALAAERGVADTSLSGVLPSMVGATAPPWRTAAIIAGAYAAVVLLVLLFSGAKRRPAAMVGCVGVGVLLAGGVLGMNSIKSVDTPLTVARLSVVEQTAGATRRQDVLTFYGQNRDDIQFKLQGNELPRAMLASGKQPPRVSMFPFAVTDVSASTGSYDSVWQIRSQQASTTSSSASIAFGPDGASLVVDTGLAGALEAPRLLSGGSVFSLPTIAPGRQTVTIGPRNQPGDWASSAGVITDEKSKLRTDILQRVESRRDPVMGVVRRSTELKLVGYAVDDQGSVQLDGPSASRSETLIRGDVSIAPAAAGTAVRIDPGFTTIRREGAASLPYRPEGDVWNEASQGGPWLFAVAPPAEIGKFTPKQLRLEFDCRGLGFDIQVLRGQCQDGRVRENLRGEVVVSSKNSNGGSRVTVDLTPSDFDANGWVWLRLSVDVSAPSDSVLGAFGEQMPTNWRMMRFAPTLIGTVNGAPQAVVQTWASAEAPKPTPKPPAAKPPANKPAAPKAPAKKDEKKPEANKTEPKKPEAKP